MKPITALLLVAAVGSLSFPAAAQWQWIDQNGRKVFSDRAPPVEVPDKNILKQPKSLTGGADVSAPPAAAPAAAPAPSGKPNGVDKELAERKKQATETEAAKRKAEEERIARMQAESCARARQAKAGLDAGARVARTNEKGEREFLDDAGRAEEIRRAQAVIDADCK